MSNNDKKPSAIYAIRCTANGKVYVGRTINIESRIRQHFAELRRGAKKQSIKATWHDSNFQEDFKKYGESAFEYYILEENVPHYQAGDRELYWINEYRTTDKRYGYNRSVYTNTSQQIPLKAGLPPKMTWRDDE